MAAEVASIPVNGTYAPHHGYNLGQQQQQQNNNNNNPYTANQQSYSQPPSSSTTPAATSNNQPADIPKDEVGWYFVEQYYTTLSKSPEKLYLYYNKRSQYVSGNETDKVQVCVGQRAIDERIKELDFQDCKVRITNVDSQASDQNIVIQVIGEISNKSQPHRKFTQTFVLATQTNGYFVLNDIFRFIVEEEDEQEPGTGANTTEEAQQDTRAENSYQEPLAETEKPEPKTLTSSLDPTAVEDDAKKVDKGIQGKLLDSQAKAPPATTEVNGISHSEQEVEEEEDEDEEEEEQQKENTSVEAPAAPLVSEKAEKPTERQPTPAASPPKQTSSQPAAPPKPAVPKTWASMAASANKSTGAITPAVPAQQSQKAAASTKSAAPAASPAPTAQAAAAPPPAATPAAQREEGAASDSQDEWTAVGSNHNRQQSRQVNGQQQEGPQRRGYIKNVHEHVQGPELREALENYGKVAHFDIARQKNCAFIDFETPEGYQAAVAANPHVIGPDRFIVEERKLRPGSTPYVPRGQFQGGRGGRGDFRGGRGAFNQRGRGQGGARGGRGGAQQA